MAKQKTTKRNTKSAKGDKLGIRAKLFEFKREQILEVAEKLFFERGYSATTVGAIAEELRVTKPFIYYYFDNKEDILHVLVKRTMQRNINVYEGVDIENGDPVDVLRALCERTVKLVIEIRTSIAMFWREQNIMPESEKRYMHEMKQKHDAQLTRVLERGIASGEFAMADPKLTALAIQGMLNWIYTWYHPKGRLEADEIANKMADLAIKIVSAR